MAAGLNGLSSVRFNPADKAGNVVLSNNNLTNTSTSVNATNGGARCLPSMVSGKWYAEFTYAGVQTNAGVGISSLGGSLATAFPGVDAAGWGWTNGGQVINNNVSVAGASTFINGDVLGVALDQTNSRLYFSKNGVWVVGDPAAGTGGVTVPADTYYLQANTNGNGAGGNNSVTISQSVVFPPPLNFLVL